MSDDRFDKLEKKLEEIKDNQAETNQHLAIYNEQLKIHIKGTEENRDDIRNLSMRFIPIEDHVKFIKRLMALIIAAIGLAVAVTEILSFFR